eukprot:m.83978 g.83978  ORF g.83978 m.83978 type:complete len:758 (-) comp11259_c0_seq2:79-2352(-)
MGADHTQSPAPCGGGNSTWPMPLGSFTASCFNCSIDYHVLLCRCARPEVGLPATLKGGANLTGEWITLHNGTAPPLGVHQDTILIQLNGTLGTYTVICADGGADPRTCSARPTTRAIYGPTPWHVGSVNTTAGQLHLTLDNTTEYTGVTSPDNNTITWTWLNVTHNGTWPVKGVPLPLVWRRRAPALTGIRTSISLKSCEAVGGWPGGEVRINVSNEAGYLTCDWSDAAPPRVGEYAYSLTSTHQSHQVNKNCRVIPQYTFLAPQMKRRGDPVGSVYVGTFDTLKDQQRQCCSLCHTSSRNGGAPCKAWTLLEAGTEAATCYFVATASTAYPTSEPNIVSGYVVQSDPATLCQSKFQSNTGFWGDRLMAPGTNCLMLPPQNGTAFPAWWWDGKRDRGTSWLFFPTGQPGPSQCECIITAPQTTQCKAPNATEKNITDLVQGKPWIVFTHGGFFEFYDGKDANYAETNSKVVAASGIGVLAPDFRELAGRPQPFSWKQQLEDIIASLLWLHAHGASRLYIYGDSSGGALTIQTLLYMAKKRLAAKRAGNPDPFNGLNISAAGTFSGWFDMSDSFPQYDERQYCKGRCTDIGSSVFAAGPGQNRVGSACQARKYADYEAEVPLNDAVISPIDAPSELLAMLPPLMLVVGGAETLLGENIAFAQRCHLAGTPAIVQVYTGMWHDFIQETEGCHNKWSPTSPGKPLKEAVSAIQRLGDFFRRNESCKVVCSSDGQFCSGAAAVKWNFNYHELPPPTPRDCQ